MNVYLASSWRNEQQPAAVKLLQAAGHKVYDLRNPRPGVGGFQWSAIDPNWKQWTAAQYRDALNSAPAVHGLGLDFAAMNTCDAMVMLQPCGRSAALELGWAIGAGKQTVVVLAEGQEPELMFRLAHHLVLDMGAAVEALAHIQARL